ncbi:hypothetical protein WMY93_006800 [Mugilogobius chulae]|uniref:Uncharacterized protein n=1 Tax=Mugilogobius chulae TaxID=88201 RepID=A0AAW0PKR1_9GOBI
MFLEPDLVVFVWLTFSGSRRLSGPCRACLAPCRPCLPLYGRCLPPRSSRLSLVCASALLHTLSAHRPHYAFRLRASPSAPRSPCTPSGPTPGSPGPTLGPRTQRQYTSCWPPGLDGLPRSYPWPSRWPPPAPRPALPGPYPA